VHHSLAEQASCRASRHASFTRPAAAFCYPQGTVDPLAIGGRAVTIGPERILTSAHHEEDGLERTR